MKNKSILFGISTFMIVLLLVGTISALEFDNVKEYDSVKNEITFTNVFGLGGDIAKARLDTPQINYVMAGKDRLVAEITIDNYIEYTDFIKGMELIDLKTGKPITREITYKYAEEYQVDVPLFQETCKQVDSGNGTKYNDCSNKQIGTKKETRINWIPLNKLDLKIEKKTIGIFTDVLPNDNVEWYPEMYGMKVTEWATWTDSLNASMQAYWAMNEVSTNTIANDSYLFKRNISNMDTNWSKGLIGNAHYPNGIIGEKNTTINLAKMGANSVTGFTISFYLNRTQDFANSGIDMGQIFNSAGELWNGASPTPFNGRWSMNNQNCANRQSLGVDLYDTGSRHCYDVCIWIPLQRWEIITMTMNSSTLTLSNSTTSISCALNAMNLVQGELSFEGNNITTQRLIKNIGIDEVAVWNRTLTASEKSDLWNGGVGLEYGTVAGTYPISMTTSLSYPSNYYNTSNNNIYFSSNATATNGNFTNATLYIWGSSTLTNSTNLVGAYNSTNLSYSGLADGYYNWSYRWCMDNSTTVLCQYATENRTFTIDSTAPSINILSPSGEQGIKTIPYLISLNASITDTNLQNCSYNISSNSTKVVFPCNTLTNVNIITTGSNTIYVFANDSFGNSAINSTTITSSAYIYNVIYNNISYETSTEIFVINFTLVGVTTATSILNYAGTPYTSTVNCTTNNCLATNIIDIPVLVNGSKNNTFFYNLTIFNGSSSFSGSSNNYNQTVLPLNFTRCNSGNVSLNFTGYDEQNLTRFSVIQFDASFQYWTGSGTSKKQYNITVNQSEVNLCFDQSTPYYLDAIISFVPNPSTGYTTRNYFYQKKVFNQTRTDVGLYSLLTTSATGFVFKVQDENIQPAKEMLVEVQRFYPGTNSLKTMFISRTSVLGATYGDLEANSALYQFLITNNSVTLLTVSPPDKVVPQTAPYTLLFQLGGIYSSPFVNIENITDITYTLLFNKTSSNVVLTYSDTSGAMSAAQLRVTANNLSGTTYPVICDNYLYNLSIGVISCNVSGSGAYTATAYFYRSPARFLTSIPIIIENMTTTLGGFGFLLGFFILIICVFMFKFNEIAGIVMTNVGIWAIQMLGLINFGYTFCISISLISIIVIWVIER